MESFPGGKHRDLLDEGADIKIPSILNFSAAAHADPRTTVASGPTRGPHPPELHKLV